MILIGISFSKLSNRDRRTWPLAR